MRPLLHKPKTMPPKPCSREAEPSGFASREFPAPQRGCGNEQPFGALACAAAPTPHPIEEKTAGSFQRAIQLDRFCHGGSSRLVSVGSMTRRSERR
jgi:hypothetical protein